jgi:7-hydroxymethyl chlorophyll a reductase
MSKTEKLEESVHGRKRDLNVMDQVHFGVYDEIMYAKKKQPLPGAQWTGIITSVAVEMLKSGKVDGVVCVQSDPDDKMLPNPILATSVDEILASRGVKPSLSPNLRVLEEVERKKIKRLLYIGVGCSVQALRSVEHHLRANGLEELYVMGTLCTDNGPKKGLKKFLNAASEKPETVTGYEFMQDYKVHLKHSDGWYEKIPYFSLPADDLNGVGNGVIAPSCYACFDYMNNLADLVVGYMGVPWQNKDMTQHDQFVVVRNAKGQELLNTIRHDLDISPPMSSGSRQAFVLETVKTDDAATLAQEDPNAKTQEPAPKNVGSIIAWILEKIGPRGLEFARYSLDYHWIRNWLYVQRNFKPSQAERHIPEFVKKVVAGYDQKGEVTKQSKLGRKVSGR